MTTKWPKEDDINDPTRQEPGPLPEPETGNDDDDDQAEEDEDDGA